MGRLRTWLKCIAEAVKANGLRALAGLMPFGEPIYDIAADAYKRIRERQSEEEQCGALQEVAAASAQDIKFEAAAVAREVAADQPSDVRRALELYLVQVPSAVRQTLKRPPGPSGSSLPLSFILRSPEQLIPMLPTRLPRFKVGDRPVGNWELADLLGVGGFGEVWLARHPRLKGIPPVALKFCLDRSAADVLRNEADLLDRVMQQSGHPGIVQLRQAYLDADPLCLEYEYVAGGDLAGLVRDWQQPPGGPSLHDRTHVLGQLAAIVGHAHRLRPPIVHRDLKPANVLVERHNGAAFHLRVADFGIGGLAARHALDCSRRASSGRGDLATALRGSHTPLYASPQQMRGDPPDVRDDVHALGVIWYQLLTTDLGSGRPGGKGWRRKLAEQGLGREWLELLEASFDDDPAERPADAALLAECIDSAFAPAPIPVTVQPPRPAKPTAPSSSGEVVVAQAGPADFRTISDALRECPPGTRILVRPGTYREGLVLTRPVEVVGDGPREDVIVEADGADCVLMKTDQAVVRGLTLRGKGGGRGRYFAVDVPKGRLLLENCDISNDSLSCIGLHGATVDATIRNCKVHDGKQGGIYAYDKARGTIENCDVFSNALAAVTISQGGDILVRNCNLFDSKQGGGVYVHDNGLGTIENCDIYANHLAGVEIKQNGAPVLRGCKVRDGKQNGVYVHDNGKGTIESCDIFGNTFSGVAIKQGGDPLLRDCQIHDGKQSGAYVHEKGLGTIENCDIFDNQYSGIEIKQGGAPTVRHCKLHGHKEGSGAYIYDHGAGTVEHCDLYDNHYAGVAIRLAGAPVVRHCKIHDHPAHDGVTVWEDGEGLFEDCDVFGNRFAGVRVRGGAQPTLRNCRIHDGQEGGLFFLENGRGTIEGCDVYANGLAGVEIKGSADPVLRDCKVRDGKQSGVYVHENGKGTFESCDIAGNTFSGVAIKQGGDPVLRDCKVHDGKQSGVYVYEQGRGLLERCAIFANAYAGVEIKSDGDPVVRDCRVCDGTQSGFYVHENGKGTIENCAITGNARGPWNIAAGCQVQRSGNREG